MPTKQAAVGTAASNSEPLNHDCVIELPIRLGSLIGVLGTAKTLQSLRNSLGRARCSKRFPIDCFDLKDLSALRTTLNSVRRRRLRSVTLSLEAINDKFSCRGGTGLLAFTPNKIIGCKIVLTLELAVQAMTAELEARFACARLSICRGTREPQACMK